MDSRFVSKNHFLIFSRNHTERGFLESIMNRLHLRQQYVTSANQVWKVYDDVLTELARVLGKDVSEVIEFQSIREMESMKGCTLCPLYQREICKPQSC